MFQRPSKRLDSLRSFDDRVAHYLNLNAGKRSQITRVLLADSASAK
jgi:hypothetical protein